MSRIGDGESRERHGLYDDFEGYRLPADEDLDRALQSALIVLDANVLLNLYRYNESTRDDLLQVMRRLGDRLWVPHQVIREFWRSRLVVMTGRGGATEQAHAAFAKQRKAASDALNQWAKQIAYDTAERDKVHGRIEELFNSLDELIDEHDPGSDPSSTLGTDQVIAALEPLLSDRVGTPFDPVSWNEEVAKGNERVKQKRPPGYLDAEKLDSELPEGASGDYLVWIQAVNESKRRDMDLLLVTGDEKEDWWWRHRAELLGPRVELAAELKETSGHRLFMLRPIDLLKRADSLQVPVRTESVEDAERVSRSIEQPRWTARAVDILLSRLDAEGRPQAGVIRQAAITGGIIDRDKVYEIGDYDDDRLLRGYTRPTARITSDLQVEGILAEGVTPMLTPLYEGGWAQRFRIPDEVAHVLTADSIEDY